LILTYGRKTFLAVFVQMTLDQELSGGGGIAAVKIVSMGRAVIPLTYQPMNPLY
jgi:hypothetical protein